SPQEGRKAEINLALPAGSDFMVVHFGFDADGLQVLHDVGAQVMERINRRQRYVAFLMAHAVAQIVLASPRIPDAFRRFKLIAGAIHVIVIAHLVEDEELCFRPEITTVGETRLLEIIFGTERYPARVQFIALSGQRVNDIGEQTNGRLFKKWVE